MSHATNNGTAPSVGAITESAGPAGALARAAGSALRARICEIIVKHGTGRGGVSITDIAWRAKSNRLACNSVLRAMERRGEAGQYNSSPDRWGCQTWYLREPNAEMRHGAQQGA